MASAKDTFEPDTFASNTFACGTFRGVGVTAFSPTIGCIVSDQFAAAVVSDEFAVPSVENEECLSATVTDSFTSCGKG